MKPAYFLCISFFLLVACKTKEPENITAIEENSLRYLALGDSYTIGESVEPEERWPVELVERLNHAGVDIEEPRIIAKTGWTTQDLLKAMEMELNNEKFDLVSVLIGVNNQYQDKSIEAYENDLHVLFKKAISHSSNGAEGVFALSIPDYGVTPFGSEREQEIKKEIEEFNEVFRQVASEYDIAFYDITPISRDAKENPDLIAEDDLHPSAKMYELWVDLIIEEVRAQIPQ